MRRLRVAITLVLVLLWGAFVPAVLAADHCAAMSGMCEGPCGASATVTPPAAPAAGQVVCRAPVAAAPVPLQLDRPAPEPPPKSPARSA
jgi:hypothetical protein